MEFDQKEQEIIDLLARLKNAEEGYPYHLMASRRKSYLRQMANIGLGIGVGAGIIKNIVKGGKGSTSLPASSTASLTSSIVETIIVTAIVVEASVAAYIYRDKIADIFQSTSSSEPKGEQISSPIIESPLPEIVISETPTVIGIPTGTFTPMNTTTVSPTSSQPADSNDANDMSSVTATPRPNDNNGNHYGQTPKPVRTKEKNNPKPTKEKKNNGNKGREIYISP